MKLYNLFRFILLLAFSSMTANIYSQDHILVGKLLERKSKSGIQAAHIRLMHDSVVIRQTQTDELGSFSLIDIGTGIYDLEINQIGMRTFILKELAIDKDSSISILYPPPCLFSLKPNKCVGGHTDHIIPIVYGLPSKKLLLKSEQGLVFLGGCMISECDPKFYCAIHKKEL